MDHLEKMRPSMCDMSSVPPTEANNWGEGQIQNQPESETAEMLGKTMV